MYRPRTCSFPLLMLLALFSFPHHVHGASIHGASIKVTLLSPDDSKFWQMVAGFSEAVADDLGIELTIHTDHKRNRFSYRTLLADVLARDDKPDYVMFMAKEMVTGNMLQMAGEAGVKVLTFNTDIPESESDALGDPRVTMPHWIGQVSPDNRLAGKQLADFLLAAAKSLSRDATQERWGAIALSGTRDSSAAKDRDLGLEDAMADNALQLYQLVYANWSEQEAADKTRRLIKRYPNPDIVWSTSDGMALGAIEALENGGLTPGVDVVVGGIDWEPRALEAIHEGTMSVSLGRHFMGGGLTLLLLHDYHNGYDFAGSIDNSLRYQFEIASRENLTQIKKILKPENWQAVDFRRLSPVYNPEIRSNRLSANQLMDQFISQLVVARGALE